VYFLGRRNFRCSFEEAKKKFYSSFNAVYGKIGCCASEEVVLNMLNTKCVSAMLYGSLRTRRSPEMSRHRHSLDLTVNHVFVKILHTGSKQTVEECQKYFGCLPVNYRIDIRTVRFLDRFKVSENSLRNVFREQASRHMSEFSSKFGVPKLSSWWLLRDALYTSFFGDSI